ncbi:flagellar basal body rod protein FlgC [Sulfitobacter donghicola]|uniref:Flagellar basal body rod protein FlgB n=1 Tax=Sulfitobacter donghicola DSW-25 = KCTC 12864 = JCM 14565 TaxID=1300350 RepID=A0A073ILX9_9RHOB|nr:flagellar basal body rod protein FlgC [Sulfitobacter donghicola]KEJ90555.1 flagellar basal body rod protein FlgC [Sulfitobacter donghicola DSW-25 = KCTC 12864 = JCM 14565]KIN67800.1 Flagellar basal-body rod protein FlgC [Sulfitobacter donghicola DSW-25 = KCTC 12864 = JCM 14565]
MSDFSSARSVSASGMQAQAQRLRHLSENISNADTPGYRRKLISFETALGQGDDISSVRVSRVKLDQRKLSEIYDPSHPLADEMGNYSGSNVEILIELADAREAQRSYEANLKMFDQARQMSTSLMQLLRS